MLVVDRVVLERVEQVEQVRELERRGALVAKQELATPATKSFRSGTCASTLLPTIEARAACPRRRAVCAVSRPKKSTSVGTPRSSAAARDVRRRIDSEDRDSRADEVLQEVAVVRGELDDEIVRAEGEPLPDHLDVPRACSTHEVE